MTRIQEIRKARGLSQSELAAKSGIKLRVLQAYEQTTHDRSFDTARLETILKVCSVLDCSLYDILENEHLRELLKQVNDHNPI